MYAYPLEEHHEIRLKASLTDNQLIFLLTDKGLSFDPTNAPDADITIPIEERAIGGLGIFLIRSIMNEVSYQRLDGENRLTIRIILQRLSHHPFRFLSKTTVCHCHQEPGNAKCNHCGDRYLQTQRNTCRPHQYH